MLFRSTPRERDEARTRKLLTAAAQAFNNDRSAAALKDPGSFESVVLHGVGYDPAQPYPPLGHPYPTR